MTLLDALLFLPVAQLLALGPGPNNFMAMRNGIQYGLTTAVAATTGRVLAFALLITITAIGLGTMLASSVLAFTVLKWVGAIYLVYLGIKAWRSREFSGIDDSDGALEKVKAQVPLLKLTGQEFLVAISNPKALLLFTAIFPQFIDPTQPATEQFMVLGGTYLLTEYIASAVYALFGLNIARFVKTSRGARRLNRATGGLFMGAGAVLASSSQG